MSYPCPVCGCQRVGAREPCGVCGWQQEEEKAASSSSSPVACLRCGSKDQIWGALVGATFRPDDNSVLDPSRRVRCSCCCECGRLEFFSTASYS